MRTLTLTMLLVLAVLVLGCEKDEVSNVNEKVDQVDKPKDDVETDESEGEEESETEDPEGSEGEESTDENTEEGESTETEEGESTDTEDPEEAEEPEESRFGNISYRGRIPTESSKVPTCKVGTPDMVLFIMTDSIGGVHKEAVPASENNGLVSTTSPAQMPLGRSTVDGIHLMKGNDTLYSIPNQNDLDLLRFADVTVPFEIEVTGDTELTGAAFCYTQEEIDIPDDELVNGGFGTQRLQTLWIEVEGECIDIITVTIDAYRVLEIFPFQDGLYDVPIPENYDRMDIRAYTPEFQSGVNDFQVYTFGGIDVDGNENPAYNADGVLDAKDIVKFSYECPEEEFPDDD